MNGSGATSVSTASSRYNRSYCKVSEVPVYLLRKINEVNVSQVKHRSCDIHDKVSNVFLEWESQYGLKQNRKSVSAGVCVRGP